MVKETCSSKQKDVHKESKYMREKCKNTMKNHYNTNKMYRNKVNMSAITKYNLVILSGKIRYAKDEKYRFYVHTQS